MKRRVAAFLACWLWAVLAAAQAGPRGPAELIGGARKARDERDLEQAAKRGATTGKSPQEPAPAAPGDAEQGNAAAPEPAQDQAAEAAHAHAGLMDPQERAPIASERADPSLPNNSIRVHVRDASGAPVAGAEVSLGIMSSDNTHTTQDARTGADGTTLITGLTGGERKAYRVNVPYQGAKYSSNPFRLPLAGGYDVEIRRLPVTRDERMVVLYLGATSIELKDDRIKFVQEAELLNLGGSTYVFPDAGTLVPLPKGFLAVQTQESMTDQHVVEAKGEGVRIHGSLPPGEATLLWGFDLPLEGTEAHVAFEMPWITFSYRVISDAPSGMALVVEGMPPPIVHTDSGRRFLVTEMRRQIGEAPFKHLQIALHGIPGPGAARWVAAVLALLVVAGGVWLARRDHPAGAPQQLEAADFDAKKNELLETARDLRLQHEAGETGPEYHREQMQALTDELATLLFEQAETSKAKRPAKSRAG